jgi:anti-anti-sigma regulatory factor
MKFYLIVARGSKKGLPIPITVDLFILGSDRMCQLRAKQFPPEQCALIVRENKVFVRDMDSGATTLVNGTAIPPASEWPLHAGDHLEVGSLEFVIQVRERGLSQRDLEEWAATCLDQDNNRQVYHEESIKDETIAMNAADAAASIIDRLNVEEGLLLGRLCIAVEKGVTIVRINDTKLVEDSEIAFIKKELCDNLSHNNLRVLLDCKNLQRVSSAGLMMIREFCQWLKSWGSSMAACRVNSELRAVLTSMSQIPIFRDKKQALNSRW